MVTWIKKIGCVFLFYNDIYEAVIVYERIKTLKKMFKKLNMPYVIRKGKTFLLPEVTSNFYDGYIV